MAPVSLEAGETYELKKWLTRLVKPAAAAGVRYDALASSANDEADENCTTANSQRWTSARRGAAGGWLSKHNLIIALGAVVVLALLGSASYAAQRHQARLRAELDAFKRRPVLVSWHKDPGMNEREPVMPSDCPIPVIFTTDERAAEVVVYDADRGRASIDNVAMREERPWQTQVIAGVESAAQRDQLYEHYRRVAEGRRNETYDYEMTYRLDSAVPRVYAYGYMDFDKAPVAYEDKVQDKLVCAFVSNCRPKNARTQILQELVAQLEGQIDSFGRCHGNADFRETLKAMGKWEQAGGEGASWWNIKTTTCAQYKFTVAFENSNEIDYVTEKFYQAAEIGSIPLHFGAPNFTTRFLPSPTTGGIDVASYLPARYGALSAFDDETPDGDLDDEAKEGVARLAERLKFLGSPEGRGEYERMLEWKKPGSKWRERTPFGKVVVLGSKHTDEACRLAGVVRGFDWAKSGWNT